MRHRHREGDQVNTKAEVGVMPPEPRNARSHQKLAETRKHLP